MTHEAYDGAPVVSLTDAERATLADHLREEIALQADELRRDAPLDVLTTNARRVSATTAVLQECVERGRVTLTDEARGVLARIADLCGACVRDCARDLRSTLRAPRSGGAQAKPPRRPNRCGAASTATSTP